MAASSADSRRRHADYTVACVCPMGVELAAVMAMMDESHPDLPMDRDQNSYVLGTMAGHNIVIAVLPEIGTNSAAAVTTQLLNDFPSVRFGLLVGIGGGVPDEDEEDADNDIRLGDVVVSKHSNTFGGVVQYDLGKYSTKDGFERTGSLDKPPLLLRSTAEKLAADHQMKSSLMPEYLSAMLQKYPAMEERYSHPGGSNDVLFKADYPHTSGKTCRDCDKHNIVEREERRNNRPKIHYGTIGSGNMVVKDAITRERLRQQFNVICVEMEAAGLMDLFPCLVVRGICDYADSHKNKKWQPYAAAVAAAYMKELLSAIPTEATTSLAPAAEVLQNTNYNFGLNLFDAPDIGTNDLFVGRENELDQLQVALKPGSESPDRRLLVLGGVGGIGKTQLVITYAKNHRRAYNSIFWLNAASETTLKNSFQTVADRITPSNTTDASASAPGQARALVLNWFSASENRNWLLIFDNYDNPEEYEISGYYPYSSHGSIIVTTRLPDKVGVEPMVLRSLNNLDDSLGILQNRSKRDHLENDVHARRLAERLGGFPLALATAGAFLHKDKSTWTFERYLREYEERWNISRSRPLQLREYQDRTLYTTWGLSYQRLQREDTTAAQLLKLLAYFDHKSIWEELFQAGFKSDLPEWLADLSSDSAEFESSMRVLVEYCFVEVQTSTQSYSMHTCVHDWTMASLNASVDPRSYWYAFDCVANSITFDDSHSFHMIGYARVAAHASHLVHKRFYEAWQEVTEKRLGNALDIVGLLGSQGPISAAILMCEWTKVETEKIFDKDHPKSLRVAINLGAAYLDQGRLTEAEGIYATSLEKMEKVLGRDHPDTLDTLYNFGILYRKLGKLVEAEDMYKRALTGMERVLGKNHPRSLFVCDRLGSVYCDKGDLHEGEAMCLRALKGFEKALGGNHSWTLRSVYNLGTVYYDQDRIVESQEMYLRAIAGFERSLESNHQWTRDAAFKLGRLYLNRGMLVDSEEMFTRVVTRDKKVLDDTDLSALDPLNCLGLVYMEQGKLAEAEKTFTQALSGYRAHPGLEHIGAEFAVSALENLRKQQQRDQATTQDQEDTEATTRNLGNLQIEQNHDTTEAQDQD